MKRYMTHTRLALLAMLVGLIALVSWPYLMTAAPLSDGYRLLGAWQQAIDIGRYHYHTNVVQQIHPTNRLENVGRTVQTQHLTVKGEMDRPGEAMTLRLESGGSGNRQVIDLRVENGIAYGRTDATAEWVEVEAATDLFAPGGDPMGFLSAAKDVRLVEGGEAGDLLFDKVLPESYTAGLSRYAFTIDGPAYARYMRDQMEEHLHRRGELPAGLRLDMVREYVTMEGSGEIWLNREGLPVRQIVNLTFPAQEGASEWLEAQITTDFSQWQPGTTLAATLLSIPGRLVNAPATLLPSSEVVQQSVLMVSVVLMLGGFVVLCIAQRRSRYFYTVVTLVMLVALLLGPLLQVQEVSAFADRQAARQATWQGQQEAQQAQREAEMALGGDDFNPQLDPLAAPSLDERLAVAEEMKLTARSLQPALQVQQSAPTCTVNGELDSDCDGLSDVSETTKLGTDPYNVDTDGDMISDKTEVDGYFGQGKQWYLNPLNPDSNGDGLIDNLECPELIDIDPSGNLTAPSGSACADTDGDGVADVFDHDNDGDGVPDRQDSAPNYLGALTTEQQTEFAFSLDGYATETARPVAITFELRPTRYEDLYQTNNVLDWPDGDTQGQVMRVNDNTFADLGFSGAEMAHGDMMLVPMLEIRIPAPAANSANPSGGLPVMSTFSGDIAGSSLDDWLDKDALKEYGVTVSQNEDTGEIYAYLPLTVIEDTNGGAPLAWGTQMLYRPEVSSFGLAHQVKMVWQVQALNDTCDTGEKPADADYDEWCAATSGHWVTEMAVIHAYYEPFYVTGLTVQEAHGYNMAVIGQANALAQPYAADLWHVANGLMGSFVEGARIDDDNNGTGDRRFDVAEIVSRFGAGSGVVWDVDTANLVVTSSSHPDQVSGLRAMIDTTIPTMLETNYTPAANDGDSVTLLIAREEAFKSISLAHLTGNDVVSDSSDRITVNLSLGAQTVQTYATLHWTPYTYTGAGWRAADIFAQLDRLETNLDAYVTGADIDEMMSWFGVATTDPVAARIGAIAMARSFYLSLYNGSSQVVEDSDAGVLNDAVVDDGDYSRDFDGDGQLDETWLVYVATSAGLMQTFFQREGEPLLDEFNEVLELIGYVTIENDESDEVDPTAVMITSAGNAVKGALKKAVRLFYKVQGAQKYYPQRGYVSKVMVAASIATLAIGLYIGVSGDTSKGIVLALDSVKLTSEILGAVDAVYSAYKVGKGFADAATTAATVTSLQRSVKIAAVIGFVFDVAIATTFFVLSVKKIEPGSLAFNALLAQYIAELILSIITLIIAATVIGSVFLAIVGLIDAVIGFICKYNKAEESEDVETWVCGGLSGIISQILVYYIYDLAFVVDLEAKNRLTFAFDTPIFARGAGSNQDGILQGNTVTLGVEVTNTLKMGNAKGIGSSLAKLKGEFFTTDNLKRSTFTYTLQTEEIDHYNTIDLGDLSGEWQDRQKTFHTEYEFVFDQAGLNVPPGDVYLTESFKVPALECWGYIAQICRQRVFRDALHFDLTGQFRFDVFPASFAEFVTMALADDGGYRMAWSGNDFPVLWDADGDGLVSQAHGGPDPNDNMPDTDRDGLSDFWEYQNGTDPLRADSDNDGLSDYWELVYNTNSRLADSDADGLLDGEELFHPNTLYPYERSTYTSANTGWSGGWEIVYARDSAGVPWRTLVTADPRDVDVDGDLISDSRERVYGYNPMVAETLNVLSLDTASQDVVAPSGTLIYTATVKNELDNRIANGLLQAEFPVDTLQTTAVMETLFPQQAVTMTGSVVAPAVSASTTTSLTLRAGAVIQDPSTGRVLWLHLNESGSATSFGDDALSLGGPHNATCSGAACPTTNAGSVIFDGGDSLTVGDHAELDLTQFTVSLWVKRNAIGGAQTYVAKGNSFSITSNGYPLVATLYLGDCTTPVSVSGGTLNPNTWQNVIVTYDGAHLRLYYNGVQQGNAVAAGSICTNDNPVTIGSGFNGEMDEVEIYPRALLPDEVATLTNKPVFYLSHYRFTPNGDYETVDGSDYGQARVSCSTAKKPTCPAEQMSNGNRVFSFNEGQTLAVTTRSNLQLGGADNAFAMSMWINPDGSYTPDNRHMTQWGQLILGNERNGYEKAHPTLYQKGQKLMVRFGHADGQGYCEAISTDVLTYDTWQHITLTFNGTVFDLYRDGVLVNSFTGANCAGETLYPATDFYIGHNSNPALYFTKFDNIVGANNGEGFIWSEKNDYNNGIGSLELVWNSTKNVIDEGDTIPIDAWAKTFGSEIDFMFCDRDKPEDGIPTSCSGKNTPLILAPPEDPDQWVTTHAFYQAGAKSVLYDGGMTPQYYGVPPALVNPYNGVLHYNVYSTGFSGMLDEIRLYRSGLTAEEAATLYEGAIRSVELTFDEPPGQDIFADVSGNDFDAICSGATCPDSGIPGRSNQAARFDGVDDRLTLTNADKAGLTNSSFTVLAWIKADAFSGHQAILGTDDAGNFASLQLGFEDGKPRMAFGGSGSTTTYHNVLAPGRWYHVAYRYDRDLQQQSIFVNGADVQVTPSNRPAFIGTGVLRVGTARGGNYFDGLIDHLVIAKRALSVDEVVAVMNEAPVLNLHLDEDLNTSTFVDDTPRANHATCAGAACPAAGSKGQMREAAVFNATTDGADDALTVAYDPAYDLERFTVGFWVKPRHSQPKLQPLVDKRDSSGINYSVLLHANNTVRLIMSPADCSAGLAVDSAASIMPNQWNHVMATYDGETMRLYINGVADVKEKAYVGTPCLAPGPVRIVRPANSSWSAFDGELDEVTIHGAALTAREVRAIFDYQNAWYDTTAQHLIKIDADQPIVSLDVYTALPLAARLISLSAVDVTSHVEEVLVTIKAPDGSTTTQAATANKNAWLLLFSPTMAGDYRFSVEATDSVGNKGTIVDQLVQVDGAAPTAGISATQTVTGSVTIVGSVSDDVSGVAENGVSVEVLDDRGSSLAGTHPAAVDGAGWAVAYPIVVPPYGAYDVRVTATDKAGNRTVTTGTTTLDAYGAIADVTLPTGAISTTAAILRGTASDLPYPLANRLLHLHFEEAAGATLFTDGALAHAAISCSQCPTAGVTGRHGKAVAFDGVDDYLEGPALLDPSQDTFTAALWFKVESLGAVQTLLQQTNGTGMGRAWLYVGANGKLGTNLGSGLFAGSQPPVVVGEWYHAAVSYDGATLSLYLNGEVVAQSQDVPEAADGSLLLGVNKSGTQARLHGALDEVVIYESALPAEVLYDLAHPLAGAVASAQIRIRSVQEGELGPDEGDWQPLSLTDHGGGFATWQHTLPGGMEGLYKIDLKASDSLGNSSYIANAWSGEIDMLAPRVTLHFNPIDAATAEVQCVADDFNIDPEAWTCPAEGQSLTLEEAEWFMTAFSPLTKTVGISSGVQMVSIDNREMVACDLLGNCATVSADGATGNAYVDDTGSLLSSDAELAMPTLFLPVLVAGREAPVVSERQEHSYRMLLPILHR